MNDRRPVVTYVDVPWALDRSGSVDRSLASVEKEVFGDCFELRFVAAKEGKYPLAVDRMREPLSGADALVINRFRVCAELLDVVGPQLRVVCRQGVGYDNLSPALLEERGVVGFNVPDYCLDEVAAHTLALSLALERGLLAQHQGLIGGKFDIYAGGIPRRIHDLTAGVVGFGRVGRAVACRLKVFYGRVIAYDPYVNADVMAAYGVSKVDFAELLGESGLVSIHCLLHDETYRLFDSSAFARMRPGSYLVNAARGAVVDAQAIYEALGNGTLAGAGLDVFHPENPHEDDWWRRVLTMPNVLVTSHRAFLSAQSADSQRRRAAEGIRYVLEKGRPPPSGHVTAATHPALSVRV